MGWHLFEKSSLTLERQEGVLGAAEGEYEFAALRRALINLFPDTIISQEKRSVPDRKPGHMTDWKSHDRLSNLFRKPRDGKTGRYIAHETDAHDAEEDPSSEQECEEESDLTAAFEREMDEVVSVVEELEDTLDVQDVEAEVLDECLAKNASSLELVIQYCAKHLTLFRFCYTVLAQSCAFPWCQETDAADWQGQVESVGSTIRPKAQHWAFFRVLEISKTKFCARVAQDT